MHNGLHSLPNTQSQVQAYFMKETRSPFGRISYVWVGDAWQCV